MMPRRACLALLAAGLLAAALPAQAGPADRFRTLQDSLDLRVLLSSVTTAYPHALPPQAGNIELTARRLSGMLLEPGQSFSFLQRLGPFTTPRGYREGRTFMGDRIATSTGGGVCQVAGTLYDAVLLAHLEVLERHPHTLLVPYLPPGLDATVSEQGGKDLRFRNSTAQPVLIRVHAADHRLTIALYGRVAGPAVSLHQQVLEWYPTRTKRLPDPALPRGTERVAAPGQAGCRVRVWAVVRTARGESVRPLGIDTYQPSPRIVQVGTGPPSAPPPAPPG